MATKTLSVKLLLNIKDFSTNLKLASKQMSAVLKKMGSGMSSVGKKMSLGLTLPIVGVGVAMVKLASDAEETRNRFTSTMGDMTKSADKFVNEISSAVGRNKTDIMDGLSSFQQFGVGMGFTANQAFGMAKQLQALSIDFASFNNLSDDEALTRFIAGMSGSSEVFDKFGINIKASNLSLKLQELGLAESTAKATEAQKATARLAIITETLGKQGAIGDAVKTSKTFANVLKRLTSAIKTVGESMGNEIIPIVTEMLTSLIPLVEGFVALNGTTKRIIIVVAGLVAVIGPLLVVLGAITTAVGALIPVFAFLGSVFASVIIPLLLIGTAVIVVLGAWDDLVLGAKMLWTNLLGLFDTGGDGIFSAFTGPIKNMIDGAILIFNFGITNTKEFVESLLSLFINIPRVLLNKVLKGLQKFMNKTIGFYNAFANKVGLTPIKPVALGKFKDDYKVTFEAMEEITGISLKNIKEKAGTAFDVVAGIGKEAGKRLSDNFGKGIDKITGKLKSLAMNNPLASFVKGGGTAGTAPVATPTGTPIVPPKGGEGGGGPKEASPFEKFKADAIVTEEEIQQGFIDVFNNISDSFASNMSEMIVEGGSFTEMMTSLWKTLAKSIIAMLIKMAIQFVASKLLMTGAEKVSNVSKITGAGAVAFANGVGSWAGAPWPINIGAPAFGASMQATALSALPQVVAKDGGITSGPTNTLLGEAGQEALIPLEKLNDFGGQKEQTINVILDSEIITSAVIKEFPKMVRLETGVIM